MGYVLSGREINPPLAENYFNYFTEIEEHFQKARGTSLFLLSPLDWALIESWKNASIPLEAVLRGIDGAFEKWRARPPRARIHQVNSVAYCAQAIGVEAQALANAGSTPRKETTPPFPIEDVRAYLARNVQILRAAGFAGRVLQPRHGPAVHRRDGRGRPALESRRGHPAGYERVVAPRRPVSRRRPEPVTGRTHSNPARTGRTAGAVVLPP